MDNLDNKIIIKEIIRKATPFNDSFITIDKIKYKYDPELKKVVKRLGWFIMLLILAFTIAFNLLTSWLSETMEVNMILYFVIGIVFLVAFTFFNTLATKWFIYINLPGELSSHLLPIDDNDRS